MAEVLCPVVVGRDAEIATLRDALLAAERGAGSLVALVGEAGIGKSRLLRELTTLARQRDAVVVHGRAVATGGSSPYRPWTEVLLQAARQHAMIDDPELAPWLPALGAILPASTTGVVGAPEESDAVRGEAVLRVLRRLARPRTLVVTLEDLHWADPDTLAVVEYLADHVASEQLLCAVTVRSEPPSPALALVRRLRGRPGTKTLTLGRLGVPDVTAMVRACMPDADDDMVARVGRAADGVPFLIEEVLASPGVPVTLAETVRVRLAGVDEDERTVVQAAAVLGRFFDWRLLGAMTGLPDERVAVALEHAVDSLLLTVEAGGFRFRHALTREAVVEAMLPPRRSALAATALAALEAAHPGLPDSHRDVAADLAEQAGDAERASALLAAAGAEALAHGALATAAASLGRAVELLGEGSERDLAETRLVEALALAGRADEATVIGERLLGQLSDPDARAEVLFLMAHAEVAAARWASATARLEAADGLVTDASPTEVRARIGVLRAEIAIAGDDIEGARRLTSQVLAGQPRAPAIRCHALELLGRVDRIGDLDAARAAFDEALTVAEQAGLPVWRMRALHELGTIEMFDHAGTARLLEARRAAGALGALSTGAIIDVHLAAAFTFRFELEPAAERARAAVAMSERLGVARVRALGLMFLAEIHGMARDHDEMERFITLAVAAAPGDTDIEGSGWAGARAMLRLLNGDDQGALADFERGIALMRGRQGSGPANYRGLWPLLLAVAGDPRAARIVAEERQAGMTVNRGNRGLLDLADAVLAGRLGDRAHATALAAAADANLVHYPVWADVARLHVAPQARRDGWGDPLAWLESARDVFLARGFDELAARCGALLADSSPGLGFGLTAREADVLAAVARGLANKEIAAALSISPRTVEKHIESILRKSGARSRTHLVALAGGATT